MKRHRGAIILLVLMTLTAAVCLGVRSMKDSERVENSPQREDGIFVNPNGVRNEFFSRESWDVGKKFLFEKRIEPRPRGAVPILKINPADWTSLTPAQMRFSWLGHSSLLIAMEGALILADPVFDNRASPISWIGPERFFPPPVTAAELLPLDVVLITHDHYDHLERPTIMALVGKTAQFIVPLGIADLLLEWGVPQNKVTELDWWESHEYKGVKFTATPAVHYASRGPLDFNKRLWVSWAINGRDRSAFISGDSGYFEAFKEVGRKLGPFDVAFLKIGAYADEGTWRRMHMTPEEAVAECLDVRGKLLVPHHWATFDLGLHPWKEPMERAVKSAEEQGVPYATPKPGELMDLGSIPQRDFWWERVE